jgi:hypothetical protein
MRRPLLGCHGSGESAPYFATMNWKVLLMESITFSLAVGSGEKLEDRLRCEPGRSSVYFVAVALSHEYASPYS